MGNFPSPHPSRPVPWPTLLAGWPQTFPKCSKQCPPSISPGGEGSCSIWDAYSMAMRGPSSCQKKATCLPSSSEETRYVSRTFFHHGSGKVQILSTCHLAGLSRMCVGHSSEPWGSFWTPFLGCWAKAYPPWLRCLLFKLQFAPPPTPSCAASAWEGENMLSVCPWTLLVWVDLQASTGGPKGRLC